MSGLFLPPGAAAMPENVQRKLQQGDPSVGWPGNPNMWIQVCDGKHCGSRPCGGKGWLVCEAPRSGGTKYVMHNPSGRVTESFIARLADAARKTPDQLFKEVDEHNAKVQAAAEKAQDERDEEGARRLEFELKKHGVL